MKILVLNPHDAAAQQVIAGLKGAGHALLMPEDVEEAWQMLQMHGASVDLAWIHRESSPQAMNFLDKVRGDVVFKDLAVLMTTAQWNDTQCSEHQNTASGANAYLNWPATPQAMLKLVGDIFSDVSSGIGIESPGASGPSLELSPSDSIPPSSLELSIRLEAPTATGGVSILQPPLAPPPALPSGPTLELPTALGLEVANTATPEGPVLVAPPSEALGGLPIEMPPTAEGENSLLSTESVAVSVDPIQELASVAVAAPSFGQDTPEAQKVAEISDNELAQAMPYIFGKSIGQAVGATGSTAQELAQAGWAVPVGDAVVPGGAANTPDTETLKKYLLLREQDVVALSAQLKTVRDQVKNLEELVAIEKGRSAELGHEVQESQNRIGGFEKEKANALAAQQSEIQELQFQLKARNDKLQVLEVQVRESTSEVEQIKERVRQDIRKIRVREKELENRLEIVRRDSEALLSAREAKIIELKRRLDLLEFNMDLLQDQFNRQREINQKLEEKLNRAAQVVRVAGGLLVEETKQAS